MHASCITWLRGRVWQLLPGISKLAEQKQQTPAIQTQARSRSAVLRAAATPAAAAPSRHASSIAQQVPSRSTDEARELDVRDPFPVEVGRSLVRQAQIRTKTRFMVRSQAV